MRPIRFNVVSNFDVRQRRNECHICEINVGSSDESLKRLPGQLRTEIFVFGEKERKGSEGIVCYFFNSMNVGNKVYF